MGCVRDRPRGPDETMMSESRAMQQVDEQAPAASYSTEVQYGSDRACCGIFGTVQSRAGTGCRNTDRCIKPHGGFAGR